MLRKSKIKITSKRINFIFTNHPNFKLNLSRLSLRKNQEILIKFSLKIFFGF
jgi:hypothetical protein